MRIEEIFRAEHGRILATLIRLVGGIDEAEEALQDAFATALEQWPTAGARAKPVAWLVSPGRHKAIDRLRRRALLVQKQDEIALHIEQSAAEDDVPVPGERLPLSFPCRPPA